MDQVDVQGMATTLVHFVFQEDPERIACVPNMVEFHSTQYHPNYQRTNDPRAVTCPQCMETGMYKNRIGSYRPHYQ
jgi:hypothetical protein